jgi:hypothetical protein
MKIGIIHLTDIHINDTDRWVDNRISDIVNALKSDFNDVTNIYIAITGDVVNQGNGFGQAESFLTKLKNTLSRFIQNTDFKFIIVPGNHDCNFENETQVRRILIENIHVTPFSEDNSIIENCIAVQNEFWNFYGKIIGDTPINKLAYQVKDTINNKIICFNCYNTAWMSSIKEEVGKMYFPMIKIPQDMSEKGCTLSISLFHHPLSWFTPNTDPNNKKEFTQHLEKNSHILLYGHEHEHESKKQLDIDTQKETIYISGKSLNNENRNNSGFKSIIIDIERKNGIIKEYTWVKNIYNCKEETNFDYNSNGLSNLEKIFVPQQSYIDHLENLELPLKFETRKNVKLSEIFVYPDLDKISAREKRIDEVFNSKRLITEGPKITLLESEPQSGKTSLLKMLYLSFLENNKYPLLIEAKKLMKNDCDKVIKKSYEEQYANNESFEFYKQYDKSNKILLIDNLQLYTFNSKSLIDCLNRFLLDFDKIIIATTIYNFSSGLNAEFKDIGYYYIQQLGYKKRNELIEKYHVLNESPQTINDQIVLEKTKYYYEQIQTVLGNKLIPSHPVYILSILQTLIYATPNNLEQTSLGYCYHSLIYVALTDKAKIKNEDIDSYFNLLTELAFSLYETNKESFNEGYLDEFYRLYSDTYLIKNLTKIKENLLLSNIIIEDEDNEYRFRYNYIFYFLISRKIAEIINTDKGKEIINNLCNNLEDEKSANILIFTTHHSKDNYLIDEATFSLMLPYELITPVTLEKDDKYYELIEGIIRDISSNIIQNNRNPKEERNKELEEKDSINRLQHKEDDDFQDDKEYSTVIKEMVHAFKALEIVGQIVKNRKGSINKNQLATIVKELYNTGFRTISYFGELSKLTLDQLIDSLEKEITGKDTNIQIEEKIRKFFQYMTLQHCLGVFSKIIFSVGNKDLKDIFDKVAQDIDSPAAKIVTFSIKSCYGKLPIKELQNLSIEFQNNPVALSILKARARSYVYHNHVEHDEKQRIASVLNMKLLG